MLCNTHGGFKTTLETNLKQANTINERCFWQVITKRCPISMLDPAHLDELQRYSDDLREKYQSFN